VDAPGKDGNASMPEQVKRPNPWRKMMMMMVMMINETHLSSRCVIFFSHIQTPTNFLMQVASFYFSSYKIYVAPPVKFCLSG